MREYDKTAGKTEQVLQRAAWTEQVLISAATTRVEVITPARDEEVVVSPVERHELDLTPTKVLVDSWIQSAVSYHRLLMAPYMNYFGHESTEDFGDIEHK